MSGPWAGQHIRFFFFSAFFICLYRIHYRFALYLSHPVHFLQTFFINWNCVVRYPGTTPHHHIDTICLTASFSLSRPDRGAHIHVNLNRAKERTRLCVHLRVERLKTNETVWRANRSIRRTDTVKKTRALLRCHQKIFRTYFFFQLLPLVLLLRLSVSVFLVQFITLFQYVRVCW